MSSRQYHTVQVGDTLRGIASRYYNGRADMWVKIYNMNRGKVSSPDSLVPGVRLIIP